jgi:hypothetical protein
LGKGVTTKKSGFLGKNDKRILAALGQLIVWKIFY